MADNFRNDLNAAELPSKSSALFATIAWVASAIVVLLLLIALLLPAVRSARESPAPRTCANNLKQIALAIINYESEFGSLPPAYTVDADGNRLHSWRTLILPYMDEKPVYELIDLTKPWDDPANAEARKVLVYAYLCAGTTYDDEQITLSTHLAVVGSSCAFSGSVPRTLAEVKDSTRHIMMVVDAPHDWAVHWMSPHDVSAEDVLTFGPESDFSHPGIFQASFLDGSVAKVPLNLDRDKLRAMLTIAGGEAVED